MSRTRPSQPGPGVASFWFDVQNRSVTETHLDMRLARDGGRPARTRPEPPMFPGGMEIAAEEIEAATRVLASKNVFR
jgi:hypothetical protein